MKKIHLFLIFLSLSLTSITYAGIKDWPDSSVCAWVIGDEDNYELHPWALAEAKNRNLTCKNKMVVKEEKEIAEKEVDHKAARIAEKKRRDEAEAAKIEEEKIIAERKEVDTNEELLKTKNKLAIAEESLNEFKEEAGLIAKKNKVAEEQRIAEEKRIAEQKRIDESEAARDTKEKRLAEFRAKLEKERADAAASTAAYQVKLDAEKEAKAIEEKRIAEEKRMAELKAEKEAEAAKVAEELAWKKLTKEERKAEAESIRESIFNRVAADPLEIKVDWILVLKDNYSETYINKYSILQDFTPNTPNYVYYQKLVNFPEGGPSGTDNSRIFYYKAECETFRFKGLATSLFKGQMGNGIEEIVEPYFPDWKEPWNQWGNDKTGMLIKVACGYEELVLLSLYEPDSQIVFNLGVLLKYAESCDESAHLIFADLMSQFEITQRDFLAMPESTSGYIQGDKMRCFTMKPFLKNSLPGTEFL